MKIYRCRVCGQDAHTFTQPALVVGRRRVIQVHCLTPGCPNHMLTTDERAAALVDQRFMVESIDETPDPDNLHLELLFRNASRLQQLGVNQGD